MTSPVSPQAGLDDITTYVPGKPVEEVQRELGLTEVIKLASNENPMAPSPKAVAAMQAALHQVNSYPDGDSHHLRHALAKHLGVKPRQVLAGNGADGLILQTCMAYLDEEDEVVVSHSSFPMYDIYSLAMRAKLVKVPLKEYRLDLEAMLAAVTPRTKLVFVCNPNNPTGTVLSTVEVDAFMAAVPDHALVVFDEAYYEFVEASDFPQTVDYVHAGRKNVMVMRTCSKVYGLAGVRLGYAIADTDVLAPLHKVREPFAVNLLAQAAGVAALEDVEYLRRSLAANAAGREQLYGAFDRLGLFYLRSHTNFVLVRVGPRADAIVQSLLARGIIVRPCAGYGLPEFLRVTVGERAQNTRLADTLESLLQAMD